MALCSTFALLCAMPVVQAQLAIPPAEAATPSRLAPLASDSPWLPRFDAVAAQLRPALAGSEAQWAPHFGGQWLTAADRARIAALLARSDAAFARTLGGGAAADHVVLGWQPPGGSDAFAALADRPEGDAILCWRAAGSEAAWPTTLAEAEDRQAHACVRVSYSVRFETPLWRAFLDAPAD